MKLLKRWFFVLALLLMLWPVYGKLADRSRFVLQGVSVAGEAPTPTAEDLLTGEYQADLDSHWRETLPGRTFLIRLRNQVLFSLLGTSSNENVAIGQGGTLYEGLYIDAYLGTGEVMSEAQAAEQVEKLQALQALLRANGKELYLFITPNKARFVQDYPWYYGGVEKSTNDYDRLTAALEGSGVPVFDCVPFLQAQAGALPAPQFYKQGIHWDHCWGNLAAAAFADTITESGRFSLAHVDITAEATEQIISPNSDVYDLLNLLPRAAFTNYNPHRTVTPPADGAPAPNALIRGSSFIDESLLMLMQEGVFGKAVNLGNINCTVYENGEELSRVQFSEYEELDMAGILAQTDLVVLECNESVLPQMGWGLVEYLLANPQLVEGGA